jgi:hypothetical protein
MRKSEMFRFLTIYHRILELYWKSLFPPQDLSLSQEVSKNDKTTVSWEANCSQILLLLFLCLLLSVRAANHARRSTKCTSILFLFVIRCEELE